VKVPTQSDIAKKVGVSRATVSYVLSGRSGGNISVTEQTRQRVLHVSRELGYESNDSAVSLRLRRSCNLGIVLLTINNPHMLQILGGATQAAVQNDYNMLVFYSEMRPDVEKVGIRELLRGQIDGLILIPTYATDLQDELDMLSKQRRPVAITTNNYYPCAELDSVTPGHDLGANELMTHLLQLGHRTIALLRHFAHKPLGQERLDAYINGLQSAGIAYAEDLVIETGTTYQDGYAAGMYLLQRQPRPTAIVALTDVLALGVCHAVIASGLRIPEDVSVAGFDNNDYTAFLNPPLTTVDVNALEIGAQAVQLVLERIAHPDRPFQHRRIAHQLIVRGSTGPAPTQVLQESPKKGGRVIRKNEK